MWRDSGSFGNNIDAGQDPHWVCLLCIASLTYVTRDATCHNVVRSHPVTHPSVTRSLIINISGHVLPHISLFTMTGTPSVRWPPSKALIRKCLLTSSVCQRIRTSRTFIDHNTKLAMIRIFAVFVFMRQNT